MSTTRPDTWFPRRVTSTECLHTGLALTLIFLLLYYFLRDEPYLLVAMAALILSMSWVSFFKYPAYVWTALTNLLGLVMSKVILSVIFFLLVTPIGLICRLCGHDPLRLRVWKAASTTSFTDRDHTFESKDLDTTF